ncbi:MAG: VanZ family protein [Pyrinomonadaceae bacterium]
MLIFFRTFRMESVVDNQSQARRERFRRYAPLVGWMLLIFIASTGELSAPNTSRILRPLLLWLFPGISEETLASVHFMVRKAAHFTEYAILAIFAARAFVTSSHERLRRAWVFVTALLVVLYSLSDEYHQSFVASRTGSIYDSLIDISGGLAALAVYALWRQRKAKVKG